MKLPRLTWKLRDSFLLWLLESPQELWQPRFRGTWGDIHHLLAHCTPKGSLPSFHCWREGQRGLDGDTLQTPGEFLPKRESCLDIWAETSMPFFSHVILGVGMPSAWHLRLAATPGSWACVSG